MHVAYMVPYFCWAMETERTPVHGYRGKAFRVDLHEPLSDNEANADDLFCIVPSKLVYLK